MTYLFGEVVVERGKHRLIDPLNQLCILTEAIAIAANIFTGGSVPFPEGNYVSIECKKFPLDVRLPLYGPIRAALSGHVPDSIQITFDHRPAVLQQYPTVTDGLKNTISHVFSPIFVDFYENAIPLLQGLFGDAPSAWPPIWNFARVVRNACSHGGNLAMTGSHPQPVTWYQTTYEKKLNGIKIIGGDLVFGDILVLMFELCDDLDKRGCPI